MTTGISLGRKHKITNDIKTFWKPLVSKTFLFYSVSKYLEIGIVQKKAKQYFCIYHWQQEKKNEMI